MSTKPSSCHHILTRSQATRTEDREALAQPELVQRWQRRRAIAPNCLLGDLARVCPGGLCIARAALHGSKYRSCLGTMVPGLSLASTYHGYPLQLLASNLTRHAKPAFLITAFVGPLTAELRARRPISHCRFAAT